MSQLETMILDSWSARNPGLDQEQLYVKVNGIIYFLMRLKVERKDRFFCTVNGVKVFGLEEKYFGELEFFGVGRVSPSSVTDKDVAKQRHWAVLEKLLQRCLNHSVDISNYLFLHKVKLSKDLTRLVEFEDFVDDVQKKCPSSKKATLLWNNAAGFTASLMTFKSLADTFKYLAHFDWELNTCTIRQRLHFIDCDTLKYFLDTLISTCDHHKLEGLNYFLSLESFIGICKTLI
ncbi:hypothetical protein MP228_007952 [Amoeboaphelidium protococcarum]|nr:hypothetical protein MP228_007952 [Amoeboaphelidium protococcarum]